MKALIITIIGYTFLFTNAYGQDNTLKAKVETPAAAMTDNANGFADTVCKSGEKTRVVELSSKNQETKLPCEIHYKKESEQPGHDQVLYTAQNDLAYCHAKAASFVDKLTGMGWTCSSK